MSTETILYITISGITALAIALFQYLYKVKKTKINYILASLRFLALFLLMLLFINPSVKKRIIEVEKPNLVVAVDQSSSIKYLKQEENVKSILMKIKSNEKVNKKFNLKVFGFGNELIELDSVSFSKTQTNISKPIQEFSKIYKKNSPIVFITDGNQTVGNSIEFLNYKSPVNTVIVGDTAKVEDIYISQLNVNKQTYLNNQLPVELFVNYTGNNSISKSLKIFHKGKIVHSEVVKLSKNKNVNISSFYIKATEKGTQFYTASIEKLKNEKNLSNNSKSFSVNIVEEKMKILLLSDIIHPDLGMLKKSIESNQQREVVIKKADEFKGNISNYQLVILYQPSVRFKSVIEEILRIKQHFFIINGTKTDWNFLNSIQSYFSKNSINQTENYLPELNLQYESFVTKDINFNTFPPLEDTFGEVKFNIPFNALLKQKIGAVATNSPMLATFETDNLKAGVLFGENLWRWRMLSFIQNKEFKQFDNFLSNLILYLASNKNSNRLNILIEPIYFLGETVKVSATYVGNNLQFDDRAKLWLTVKNKATTKTTKIPFALKNNNYFAEISNLDKGEYSYTVSVEKQNVSKFGVFKIEPFEVEQQFTNANDKSLKIIANKTGGKVYYFENINELIENITSSNTFKSIQKSSIKKTPIIDWKWLLAFILLFLSMEWFIRKYFGKI